MSALWIELGLILLLFILGIHQHSMEEIDRTRAETIIAPRRGWTGLGLAELRRYRELLFFLVWRDITVRYKQTVLGVAWAVIVPVTQMVIFTLVFGRLAKIDSDGLPYPVFVYAGLMPWTFFAATVVEGGQSLVNQRQLLTKVYFPRLFIPTSSAGAALVDLVISACVYALILAFYGFTPGWRVLCLPGLLILTALAALGAAYLLAALTVTYRDFRYVVPFLIQALMFLSPVIYPVSLVPERFHWLVGVNPMAGIIGGYRSAILGSPWDLATMLTSSVASVALFFVGVLYFRQAERRFADIA